MNNTFQVSNGKQIIVPVRFRRAIFGAPALDAPEVDWRGWNNPHHSNWPDAGVRGGHFGMLNGQTVRIKLTREHLDDSAPVYLTVNVPGGTNRQVEIAAPASGGPVPASGIFTVHGINAAASNAAGNVIEARLGAADGPIICKCEVRVFSPARVWVAPHVCTIHSAPIGPAPASGGHGFGVRPPINVTAVMELARAVWRPAGVEFIVAAPAMHEVYGAPTVDAIEVFGNGVGQADWLTSGRHTTDHINIYFVTYTKASDPNGAPLGVSLHRGNMGNYGLSRPAIFVAVSGSKDTSGVVDFTRPSSGTELIQEHGNDVSHEIGHFLTLSHFGGVNSPGRDDTYGRRNLMHPVNLLPPVINSGPNANDVRFDDVGYGTGGGGSGHRGCMLTMKRHNLFAPSTGAAGLAADHITPLDSQVAIARMQIFQSPGRPIPGVSLY